MAAYKYSYGSLSGFFKNPADVAGKVCQNLKETVGLTAKSLVDASRDPKAPLHDEFEWDDTIAGEKYRETQAQFIIRHLIIEETDTEEARKARTRSFVFTGEHSVGYVPLKEALTNNKWRKRMLEAAFKDMKNFVAKYNRLVELSEVIEKMKDILKEDDVA